MSDVAAVDQTESAGTEQAEPAPLSVMEHAKLHGDTAAKTPETEKAALAEKAAHHSEQQKRERETGKWQEGRVRHRAKSQQASPEDVPRIRELTAKLRGAEEELQRLRTQHAPPAQVAQAERRVEQAETKIAPVVDDTDPEPKEDDPKYATDYGKYLIDQARWAARDERRKEKAADATKAEQTRRENYERERITAFGKRVEAAQAKYGPEYQETLKWDVPWLQPNGTPQPYAVAVDEFVMDHEGGTEVLHYLRLHPEEVDAILRMSPLHQVSRLTLLAQRLDTTNTQSASAGVTGAATRTAPVRLPPRPPTPVRTEAQSVSGPPPTDGTLSVMDHAKKFKRA